MFKDMLVSQLFRT